MARKKKYKADNAWRGKSYKASKSAKHGKTIKSIRDKDASKTDKRGD